MYAKQKKGYKMSRKPALCLLLNEPVLLSDTMLLESRDVTNLSLTNHISFHPKV